MARHVHHVIDAAQHPDLAVTAVPRAVTGEVPTLLGKPRPVGLDEPLRVTPDTAQHRRPRPIQHEVAGDLLAMFGRRLQFFAVVVDDLGRDSRQGPHRRSRFTCGHTRQW